jgi:hypothetical protein
MVDFDFIPTTLLRILLRTVDTISTRTKMTPRVLTTRRGAVGTSSSVCLLGAIGSLFVVVSPWNE